MAQGESEVRTAVGDTDLHGTLLQAPGAVASAVLISGSGPTDRDGNTAMLP